MNNHVIFARYPGLEHPGSCWVVETDEPATGLIDAVNQAIKDTQPAAMKTGNRVAWSNAAVELLKTRLDCTVYSALSSIIDVNIKWDKTPFEIEGLTVTETCLNCGEKTAGGVSVDDLGTHMVCEHCESSFDVDVPAASDAVGIAPDNGPELVFSKNRITDKQQKTIHLEWHELDRLFTDLLTGLLQRDIAADVGREDYYYWNASFKEPLTHDELERLFESAQASEYDREANMYEEGFPIYELVQGVCSKLISKLLPFNLTASKADDEGVWFIGEDKV